MFNNFPSQVVNIEISSSYTINKTSQALFNFPPLKHISSILTDKTSHLKKSPVTRIHLPVRKSYNTAVCTHSEGHPSIRKAAKYQKCDVPHFTSTPGAKLKCNIQTVTLDNKSKPLSLYNYYKEEQPKLYQVTTFSRLICCV